MDRSDYPTSLHNHPEIGIFGDQEFQKCTETHRQMENSRVNLKSNRRRLQSSNTRYVELAIVNDPGMFAEFNGDTDLLQGKTISIVATLQNIYLSTDLGSDIGTIQIVLSGIFYLEDFSGTLLEPSVSCSGTAIEPSLYDSSPGDNYCEVQYANYLNNFQEYRSSNLKEYDNAHLFSYFDFYQGVLHFL